jgi:hypothetical protein
MLVSGLISGLLFAWLLQALEFEIGYKILDMLKISREYYYPFYGFLGILMKMIRGDSEQ